MSKQSPIQKRNREDWEAANELMAAASAFMKALIKCKARGLHVNAQIQTFHGDAFRVTVHRLMKRKAIRICDAEIGT